MPSTAGSKSGLGRNQVTTSAFVVFSVFRVLRFETELFAVAALVLTVVREATLLGDRGHLDVDRAGINDRTASFVTPIPVIAVWDSIPDCHLIVRIFMAKGTFYRTILLGLGRFRNVSVAPRQRLSNFLR